MKCIIERRFYGNATATAKPPSHQRHSDQCRNLHPPKQSAFSYHYLPMLGRSSSKTNVSSSLTLEQFLGAGVIKVLTTLRLTLTTGKKRKEKTEMDPLLTG